MADQNNSVIGMAADIVSAYISNNAISAEQLPNLISQVHGALQGVDAPIETASDRPTPAISIRKSITPDFLICLEDGRQFKSLKRHLRAKYNMSPEQYREKWGLAKDYPMVAPNYAAARSALARTFGLGQGGRKAAAPAKAPRSRKASA